MTETTPAAVTDGTPGVARYRKKPGEVEAIQWIAANEEAVREFVGPRRFRDRTAGSSSSAAILGRGGWWPLWRGDWVLREDGAFFVCLESMFDAYEPTDAAPPVAAALDRSQVVAVIERYYGPSHISGEVADQICALAERAGEKVSDA